MMADVFAVVIEGIEATKFVENLNDDIVKNAVRAINKTLDRTRTRADRAIRTQVAFPASYLSPASGRLAVTGKATHAQLEGTITGRQRPTSLARFATGRVTGQGNPSKAGVDVEIKPGLARRMSNVFLIRLRAGSGLTETKSNLGLAYRSKNGRPPSNAYKPAKLGKDLYLLYGPSVDQVFRTVRGDISPEAADFLEAEFNRLMDLNNG